MPTSTLLNPWTVPREDGVRSCLEGAFFGRLVKGLLRAAPGGRVLDLGCGDGLVHRLAGDVMRSYLGLDLHPAPGAPSVRQDLRDGLGPAGREPFDVCVATFGVASHIEPRELVRLLAEVAAAAAPGALVAIEALGLHSLEWPGVWMEPPGPARVLSYRLTGEMNVHAWAPDELRRLLVDSGLRWIGALDRTVQAGPKLGEYWPGLPPLRKGFAQLLAGERLGAELVCESLPPLPAHPAARVHHEMARARRELIGTGSHLDPQAMARAVWALERRPAAGVGHGLVALARKPS